LPAPDGPADDEVDPGEPIEALSYLDEPVSSSLLQRVRGSIQRRMLAAQLVELSSVGALVALREYMRLMLETINRDDGGTGGSR